MQETPVYNPTFLTSVKEKTVVIVSIENKEELDRVVSALCHINGIRVCSWWALEKLWAIRFRDINSIYEKLIELQKWYGIQKYRTMQAGEAVKEKVLIWQSGKVGSESLRDTLRRNGVSCAHVHRFYFDDDIASEILLNEYITNSVMSVRFSPYQGLLEQIADTIQGKKIITMIRNPIDVNLSLAFQLFGEGYLDGYLRRANLKGKTFMEAILDFAESRKGMMFDWFECEFGRITGTNVLDHPFDVKEGYGYIHSGLSDVLILRTEKMDKLLPVINGFLGTEIKEIEHSNSGNDKWYADIYTEVKKRIIYSEDYLESLNIYSSYIEHFFGNECIYTERQAV